VDGNELQRNATLLDAGVADEATPDLSNRAETSMMQQRGIET
jgi:hypothetical protein